MSAALVAATLSGLAVALLVGRLVPPVRRLAPRVRPYTVASRASLGRSADVMAIADPRPTLSTSTLTRLFGPILEAVARRLGQVTGSAGDARLLRRLGHARCLQHLPQARRVQEYRMRVLGTAVLWSAIGAAAMGLVGASGALTVSAGCLGAVAGGTRWRRRIDRAIEQRRQRLCVELYTVNQLLALHVRVGGGVIQAVQAVVQRGTGEVVSELAEALRTHATGARATDAFHRLARLTPEPSAARTYRLLATGIEHGSDLATALLALSEDVRDARRDALKRQATRRRAAMLVPIVGVLAPVMLLFVAAPLPSLIFGLR